MKKSIFTVIVSISTVIALGFGLVSATQQALQPVHGQNAYTYENPKIGLRLLYPSDWSIGEIDEPTSDFPVMIIPFEPRDKYATIAIHVSPKKSLTIEDIVANSIQFEKKNAMEIQGPGSIVMNGKVAYGYSSVGPQMYAAGKQAQSHATALYFIVQDTLYHFSLTAHSAEDNSRALPVFENMIKSAQLTGIPQDLEQRQTEGG